jgi:hypothetical protein
MTRPVSRPGSQRRAALPSLPASGPRQPPKVEKRRQPPKVEKRRQPPKVEKRRQPPKVEKRSRRPTRAVV